MAQAAETGPENGALTPLTNIKLRAGFDEINAAAGEGLAALIEKSNHARRLEGLPDHLNPEIIDLAKAKALVAALPHLVPAMIQPLAGHSLYLNAPDLLIGASAPTHAASFTPPFALEVVDTQGNTILARADVKVDCTLARERSGEARKRIGTENEQVKKIEARLATASGGAQESETRNALGTAQRRRFAVAQVWRQNAAQWARCDAADEAAKADLDAAGTAVSAYNVAPRGGMPGGGQR